MPHSNPHLKKAILKVVNLQKQYLSELEPVVRGDLVVGDPVHGSQLDELKKVHTSGQIKAIVAASDANGRLKRQKEIWEKLLEKPFPIVTKEVHFVSAATYCFVYSFLFSDIFCQHVTLFIWRRQNCYFTATKNKRILNNSNPGSNNKVGIFLNNLNTL